MNKNKINNTLLLEVKNKMELLSFENFIYKNKDSYTNSKKVYNKQNTHVYVPSHKHPYKEILTVLEGKCFVQLDNQYYKMYPGSMCYIESGIYHVTLIEKQNVLNRLLWVSIDKGRQRIHISSYFNDDYVIEDCMDLDVDPYLIERIEEELIHKKQDFSNNCICFLNAFWKMLIREYEKKSDQFTDQKNCKIKVILEIEEFVFNHISKKIVLKDIADYVNLSPNYLSYLFKEMKGVNLFDYIQTRKIEKAKELLKGWDGNISEIACIVGYTDPFYFSKVFKRIVKRSPREYRKSVDV